LIRKKDVKVSGYYFRTKNCILTDLKKTITKRDENNNGKEKIKNLKVR